MVSVIKPGRSLRNTLQYNENKLKITIDEKKGIKAAELIHSSGFAKDTDKLGFTDKIRTLEMLAARNERTKVNSIHVSLNFHPSEKDLSAETLRQIADAYMQKIGFGAQPYLVYKHNDSGHPHIHIVTTNIRHDATRIPLHNIGRNESEKARKEIEREFKLIPADQHQRLQQFEIKPVNAQKVAYGSSSKSGTKRAITNVLDAVLPSYKFTSIPELNAVLRQYNVMADQGGKDSRIYKNNGLVYRVLDEQGNKVGVPIPASHIYNRPTLPFLQQKFSENEPLRLRHKAHVKNAIDYAIAHNPGISLQGLIHTLKNENIQVVVRQNADGIVYGLTYVDHATKCVFNGSDLGKSYSANQMQERCAQSLPLHLAQSQDQHQEQNTTSIQKTLAAFLEPSKEGGLAAELREELKRRRRKKLRH